MSFQGHGPRLPLPITTSGRAILSPNTISPTQFLTTLCGRHGGWNGMAGRRERSPSDCFSEIISLDSFTLTFPMGASRSPGLERGSCMGAPSRILSHAPVELLSFVTRRVGWAPLKSTFPVSTGFLILSAYHELFKLFGLIFLWCRYYCLHFTC